MNCKTKISEAEFYRIFSFFNDWSKPKLLWENILFAYKKYELSQNSNLGHNSIIEISLIINIVTIYQYAKDLS